MYSDTVNSIGKDYGPKVEKIHTRNLKKFKEIESWELNVRIYEQLAVHRVLPAMLQTIWLWLDFIISQI